MCEGSAEGAPCTFLGATGTCRGEVCVPQGCGDGIANGDEPCDGDDVRGAGCSDVGYHGGGALACSAECLLDTTACLGGICGDGEVNDGAEACEPGVSAPGDCQVLGFYDPGAATCNAACRFDDSACTGYCGDGVLNGPESCEKNVSLLETCATFAFDYGWTECRACVPNISDCHKFYWQPSTVEQTGIVRAVHGFGDYDVWAAGDNGLLLRSAGSRFVEVTPMVSESFKAIWVLGIDEVVVAGDGGTIQHWDGSTWTVKFSLSTWKFTALWSAGPGHLIAAGDLGLLSWNGTAWTALAKPSMSAAPIKLWGTAVDDYYMVDAAEELWHFKAGAWSKQNFPAGVRAIGGRASNTVYVALGNAGFSTYRYNGTNWQSFGSGLSTSARAIVTDAAGVHFIGDNNLDTYYDEATGAPGTLTYPGNGLGDLTTAWLSQSGRIFAGSANGLFQFSGSVLFRTPYPNGAAPLALPTGMWFATPGLGYSAAGNIYVSNGTSWALSQANTNSRAIWGAASDAIYAVGVNGSIYRYNGSWSPMTAPAQTATLLGVHGTAANDVWAVGLGGGILRYNGTWSKVTSNTTTDLLAVWAATTTDAVAVGLGGTIMRWNGATWASVASGTTNDLRGVWGFASNDIWVVGDAGTVLHWNGTAWTAVASGTSRTLRGVWGAAPDDVFFAGDFLSIRHHDGYGLTPVYYTITSSTENFHSVSGSGRTVFFGGTGAQFAGSKLTRTTAWKRQVTP